MKSFNKVMLMGYLAADPILTELQNNNKVTRFTIASNREWKSSEGEDRKEVSFIDCKVFGGRAQVISDYFSKGSPIFIEGRLHQDKWEKDGQKHSRIRVVVEDFRFIDKRSDSAFGSEPIEALVSGDDNYSFDTLDASEPVESL